MKIPKQKVMLSGIDLSRTETYPSIVVRCEQIRNNEVTPLELLVAGPSAAIILGGGVSDLAGKLCDKRIPVSTNNRKVWHLCGGDSICLSTIDSGCPGVVRTWYVNSIDQAIDIVFAHSPSTFCGVCEVCSPARFSEVEKNKVVLERLSEHRLEMVRNWRNNEEISKYMFHQEKITREAQHAWFSKVDNDRNYYFVVLVRGEPLGLVNLKNVSFEKSRGEAGIFLAPHRNRPAFLGYKAYMTLLDFSWLVLGMKRIDATIRADNHAAVQFNRSFGFEYDNNTEDQISMSLDTNFFWEKSRKLRKMIGFNN